MKILLVSNSNRFFTNTNHYRMRALKQLGHEVVFFDVRCYLTPRRLRAILPGLEWLEDVRINVRLKDLCRREKVDMCLLVGGHSIFVSTVRLFRLWGIPVVLWTSDIPYPHFIHHIHRAARDYAAVFCAGTEMQEELLKDGCKFAAWLPFACDPQLHAPVVLNDEEKPRFAKDVVFVGSYYPHRQEVLEPLSVFHMGIWGPLWNRLPKASALLPCIQGLELEFDAWVKVYAAAKIVLVVHYNDGVVPCFQASPKVFEALACGAFVLCDDQKDVRALFNDGEHLVFFSDSNDLKKKVAYYLAHPQERLRIARAGREKVLKEHTYQMRMEKIVQTIKDLRP